MTTPVETMKGIPDDAEAFDIDPDGIVWERLFMEAYDLTASLACPKKGA